MNPEDQQAVDAIRATFDRVVSEGLRAESVEGASDAEIDAMAAAQGVDRVPTAVREVLRRIGVKNGLWLGGTALGVHKIGEKQKRNALATLAQLGENPFAAAGEMLVLTEHQGYTYDVVDGADLDKADPPVWVISEGEYAKVFWPSVSSWFEGNAPSVAEYRSRLRVMRQLGKKRMPLWAADIRVD
ncbi:hypothetical protein ADK67_22710 [Saccharothrix sp. NRRL B-16348]|uniref:hypothetical protein n=1 Tax=Saccharothrix sp. NRRL B-16348 TaxID=1415542 RepID=UPI0006AECCCE|nr:hypothetical protein [Saccharothrix sp. NRRL B-16348]KOX22745.1 hypothetical protein ADK67_22710 [Saccharothrix sp. NRRL B-16348]